MPLYEIEDGRRLMPIQHKTFQEVDLKERQHLQALLRDNISVISPDLLIIDEEFTNWTDSNRRIDLLGLDRDVNLVVIELKRVDDGSHMELQAIRYAAMVASMEFEGVVEAHQKFLKKQGREPESARNAILSFLCKDGDVQISSTPRIILVSPTFSKEITTAVLWLNDQDLKIKCLQARPYRIEGKLYIDIEQIIPLPSATDLQTSLRKKALFAERQANSKRREQTIAVLQSSGLLKTDTRLTLIKAPRPNITISDEKAKHATFIGGEGVRWDFDEKTYSLSGLCKLICEKYGGDVGSGAFAGPDYWAIEGDTVSLSQRAKEFS